MHQEQEYPMLEILGLLKGNKAGLTKNLWKKFGLCKHSKYAKKNIQLLTFSILSLPSWTKIPKIAISPT